MMNFVDKLLLFSSSISLNIFSRNSKSHVPAPSSSSSSSPWSSQQISNQDNGESLSYVLKSVLLQSDSVSFPSGTAWINNNVMFFVDASKGVIRRLVFVADQIQVSNNIHVLISYN